PRRNPFPGDRKPSPLSSYVKKILLVTLLLCLGALYLAIRFRIYPPVHGMGAVLFMGLNALAAVYPLYRFRQRNPFQLYLLGMVVRLGVIGAVLMGVITLGGLD